MLAHFLFTKSGFKTKAEAEKAGTIAYNEYMQTGHSFVPSIMSYSDYLDYWLKEHCEINLKYNTIEAYKNIIKNQININIDLPQRYLLKVGLANSKNTFSADSKFIFLFCNVSVIKM